MHEIYRGSDRRIFEGCSSSSFAFFVSFLLSYKACKILKCVTRDARLYNYCIFLCNKMRSRARDACIRKIDICVYVCVCVRLNSYFLIFRFFTRLICLRCQFCFTSMIYNICLNLYNLSYKYTLFTQFKLFIIVIRNE